MATRRKKTKGKAASRRPARRAAARAAGTAKRGRRGGSRSARTAGAAREVRARREEQESAELRPETVPGPSLRLAVPPVVEQGTVRSGAAADETSGRGEWVDQEAAELARRIEAAVGSAGQTLRTGPEHAADRLGPHREQTEEAARRQEEERELPGAATIGLELAIGALRLVSSVAFAPLRLGLAFLRRGDATA